MTRCGGKRFEKGLKEEEKKRNNLYSPPTCFQVCVQKQMYLYKKGSGVNNRNNDVHIDALAKATKMSIVLDQALHFTFTNTISFIQLVFATAELY